VRTRVSESPSQYGTVQNGTEWNNPYARGRVAVILFKACPRCGGDIDSTYADDINCVQCGHRPDAVYPGARLPQLPADAAQKPAFAQDGPSTECRRCGADDPARLEKLRAGDNTCYRCRRCGHIFSPAAAVWDHSPGAGGPQ